jgi:hypothetical protein
LIKIIGEIGQPSRVGRIAAQEFIKRDTIILNAADNQDVMTAAGDIAYRLASPST